MHVAVIRLPHIVFRVPILVIMVNHENWRARTACGTMGGPAEVAPSPPLVHGSTLPKQLFAGLGQTQPDADGFGAFGPGACTGALDRLRTQHFSTARVVVLLTTTPPPLWLAPFAV